jgi:hypothetical protein
MRKDVDWTVYPYKAGQNAVIQSDGRIASVNLDTGKGLLSDGKGGHQGSFKLNPVFGAVLVEVPAALIDQIRQVIGGDAGDGTTLLMGG